MESLGVAPDGDAPPGRGDPRPARPGGAAGPAARHAVGRAAAARRDRLGAHPAPPGPRARRADLGARPVRRRGGARRAAAAGARPRHDRADGRAPAGAGRAVRRPGRPACPAAAGRSSSATRPRCMADRAGRAAGRRARPAGGLVAAAAVGARRPPPGRRPDRAAARRHAARHRRRGRTATWWPRPAASWSGTPVPAGRPALRGVDLSAAGRRGRRADGPQRRRQVDAARRPGRAAPRRTPAASRSAAPTRPRCAPATWSAGSGWCRRSPATCSTPTRSPTSAPQADRDAGVPPGTALAICRRRCSAGVDPDARTRATCPRASGSPSPWPSCSPAGRRWCCSTSRPAASTTPARRRWCGCCATSRPPGTPSCSPPTTSSWPPTVADRTVVLADGEVVSDGPSREVVVSSPAFAPQVAKVLAPLPWLTVAEVAASLKAG